MHAIVSELINRVNALSSALPQTPVRPISTDDKCDFDEESTHNNYEQVTVVLMLKHTLQDKYGVVKENVSAIPSSAPIITTIIVIIIIIFVY